MKFNLFSAILLLFTWPQLLANPIISEFLASNSNGLNDEDGDSSDWIEIHNPDSTAVNMTGWHLTDDDLDLTKWAFPNVTIPANGRLLVFASGKNRSDSSSELHTNFSLNADGEYLALVMPGSSIIGTSFDPYPKQKSNVSYGVASNTTTRVDETTHLLYTLITPPNDSKGDTWIEEDYNASSWNSTISGSSEIAHGAIGYDNGLEYPIVTPVPDNTTEVWVRYSFTLTELPGLSGMTLRTRQDDGYEAFINGTPVRNINNTAPVQALEAGPFVETDISQHLSALKTGNNVLAFRLINASGSSSDLLLQTELSTSGTESGYKYSKTPTPATANIGHTYDNFVSDTKFIVNRGIFSSTFNETITCSTPGSTIIYTTDGSEPSLSNGTQIAAPSAELPCTAVINISTTTVLRAAAFLSGSLPSNTDTQSYIFTDQVVTQPSAPPGWPASPVNGQALDYGMDSPSAIGSTSAEVSTALKSIPSISVVTNQNNLLASSSGIYVNPGNHGVAWERPASVEMILPPGYNNPDGNITGFQNECGLRIRGGFSRTKNNAKHSFRLFFRSEYGDSKLNYPLFGNEGTSSFKRIDFRTAQNYAWSLNSSNPGEKNTLIRDVFNRDCQRDMELPYTRSRYFHLYLNGLYWGIYMTEERADSNYGDSYLGGRDDDFDVVKSSGSSGGYRTEATEGELTGGDWETTWNLSKNVRDVSANNNNAYFQLQGRNPSGVINPALPKYLNVDDLIDYMLVIFYVGSGDSPLTLSGSASNNWYGMRNRVTNTHGFQFFVHDTEHSMDSSNRTDVTGPYSAGKSDATDQSNPQFMHEYLANNDEYRLRFADRAHKAFQQSGALTFAKSQVRFNNRSTTIDTAIIAESARWGDQRNNGTTYTRNDWVTAVNNMTNWMTNRESTVINQLKADNLYPNTNPPSFNQHGGVIAAGFQLTITNPDAQGIIYFTTDKSDPRAPGGAVSGTVYTGPITLNAATTVKSRVLKNGEWSPLNEADFTFGEIPSFNNLVVSEFSYNAAPSTPQATDGEDFDFIEIMNVGTQSIDLTSLRLENGVTFDFSTIAVSQRTLTAGSKAIVCENTSSFVARYGSSLNVLGQWSGKLSNGGETLRLATEGGSVVQEFTYNDKLPWPNCADGDGYSLVLINPFSLPIHNNPANWRCSIQINGNPGSSDALAEFTGDPNSDNDADGLQALLEHFLGSSDIDPKSGSDLYSHSTVTMITDNTSTEHLTITFRRKLGTDDLKHQVEVSTDLTEEGWQAGNAHAVIISETHNADGTVTQTWRSVAAINNSDKLFIRLNVSGQ